MSFKVLFQFLSVTAITAITIASIILIIPMAMILVIFDKDK